MRWLEGRQFLFSQCVSKQGLSVCLLFLPKCKIVHWHLVSTVLQKDRRGGYVFCQSVSLLEAISHPSHLSKLIKEAPLLKTLFFPFCSLWSCVHMAYILRICNPLPDGTLHQKEKHCSGTLGYNDRIAAEGNASLLFHHWWRNHWWQKHAKRTSLSITQL